MNSSPTNSAEHTPVDSHTHDGHGAWLGSLAGWICLLIAISSFAAATLAPRFLDYWELRENWRRDQQKLVELEQQIERMNRVATALESEPEFSEALARVEFEGAGLPGEQRIEVPSGLTLEIRPQVPNVSSPPPVFPWYLDLINGFVQDTKRNNTLLFIAAIMALLSLVSWTRVKESAPWRSIATQLRERYKPEP